MLGAGPWSRGSCMLGGACLPRVLGGVCPERRACWGHFWVRMEACWTAKLLMYAQNVRQRRPFLSFPEDLRMKGRLWRTFIVKAVLTRI